MGHIASQPVSPTERPPLPEAGFGVDSRRRRFRDSSIDGKVSFCPPISRDPCWILRYVRWASLFISMAYSADEESLGSIDLSSDWTRRFGVFVEVESSMGDHDAPNDHAQP